LARTRRREDGFDGDARTNGPSDEVLHPGHKPVRVNGLRLKGLLTGEGQEAMREAEMADLKKHADDLSQSVRDLTSGVDPYGIARDVEASITGAAPATPPATEPAAAPVPAVPDATPAPVPVAESTPVADAPATAPDTPPPVKGAA